MKVLFIDLEKKYIISNKYFLKKTNFFFSLQVSQLSYIIKTVEAFLNINTRLVVLIDGLDVCEQQRILQILDVNDTIVISFFNHNIILASTCTFYKRK